MHKNNKVKIKTLPAKQIIDIYVTGLIDEASNYIEEFEALKAAEEQDEVHLYINSVGGYLFTAIQLVEHIKECKAQVVAHLQGECHSAATLIFLACNAWSVPEMSHMLIHNYSSGSYGKGAELTNTVISTDNFINELTKTVYTPFLTKKEIKRVQMDQDIWLTGAEIAKRLDKVVADRESKMEELNKEQLETVKKQLEDVIALEG